MKIRVGGSILSAVVLWLVLVACSGSESGEAGLGDGAGDACELVAAAVVNDLAAFIEPFASEGLEGFAGTELGGLEDFQQQVLNRIVGANADGTCFARDLDPALDAALENFPESGVLGQFVVDAIRNSGRRTRRDVAIGPDDDLVEVLNQLAAGSSIVMAEGTYATDAVLIVPVNITIVGAGSVATIIESTATEAALAVVGDGALAIEGVTLRHIGDEPASVVLGFGGAIQMQGVHLRGGVTDEDGVGGAGLFIGAATVDREIIAGDDSGLLRVVDSIVSDNEQAGIVVTADRSVTISNSVVESNGACGICALDESVVSLIANVIRLNETGVQVVADATAFVDRNELVENTNIGLALDGVSDSVITGNRLRGNGTAGIRVRCGFAQLTDNEILAHEVGLGIEGTSTALVRNNRFTGGVIGLQVAGDAAPRVEDNNILDTIRVALLIGEQAQGTFTDNTIMSTQGTGVVVGGGSAPAINNISIEGTDVGIAFGDEGAGTVDNSSLRSHNIGIQLGGNAAPVISNSSVSTTSIAGVVYGEQAAGELRTTLVSNAGSIGVQTSATAAPLITENVIENAVTGISILLQSEPHILANTVSGTDTGIDVGDSAQPTIEANQLVEAANVALSVRGTATPTILENTIFDAPNIGIQIVEQAAPTISDNVIGSLISDKRDEDPESALATVGLLYGGASSGQASSNQIFSFDVGIQVSENAAPDLTANSIDGGGFDGIGVLYSDGSAGQATGNRVADVSIGFQLVDDSFAELTGNEIERIRDASMIITGRSTPSVEQTQCPQGFPGIVVFAGTNPTIGTNDCVVSHQ